MPVFSYQAVDLEGKTVSGLVHGQTFEDASRSLALRGLQILSLGPAENRLDPLAEAERPAQRPDPIPPVEAPPTEERSYFETNVVGAIVGGVPLSQLHFFFRQLGTMLHAGINPADALETLGKQTSNLKLKSVVAETQAHVIHGRPLSAGFQRYPEVFSPLMVSMVRVGERGGFLSEQCRQLSEYIERDLELRNMIRRETAYPKIVIGFSVLIILAANAVVAGVTHGSASAIDVPWLLWTFIALVVLGAMFFSKFLLRHQPVRYFWDAFLLAVPGIGGMVQGFAMAKFGRAFGAMYKGGVPLGESLKAAADACGNEAVRSRIYPAAKELDEGRGITETFSETGAFSRIVLDMTRTGEMTGNMDEMLLKAAEYYEDDGQTNAKKAAALLGVVALLLVGAYVLYIAFGFFSGIRHVYDQNVG